MAVAMEFCLADTRFTYYYQANRGLSGARNRGMKMAKGEYLNFLDSDDSLDRQMLRWMVTEMIRGAGCAMAFCGYRGCKNDLKSVVKEGLPGSNFERGSFFLQLCKGNILPVHAALVRRDILGQIGEFDESLKSCEDWDFWLRLGRVSNKIVVVKRLLVVYRMSMNSMTRNVGTFFESGIAVLNRSVREDKRVKDPLPEYQNGSGIYFDGAIKNWYKRAIGLYLAVMETDSAKKLLAQLRKQEGQVLDERDFIDLWRELLFGAILVRERGKAWRLYGDSFLQLIKMAEGLYGQAGLAESIQKKVMYYNGPLIKRLYLRIVGH
jgi:glycosyltransferase involved in cell wall biosynthesis